MVEIDKLKKLNGDILNCEGAILAMYAGNNDLYLHTLMNDGSGKVFFKTNLDILINFYNSKINISELLLQSEDVFVLIISPFSKSILVNKNELVNRIHCGAHYYNDFPPDTKQNF